MPLTSQVKGKIFAKKQITPIEKSTGHIPTTKQQSNKKKDLEKRKDEDRRE